MIFGDNVFLSLSLVSHNKRASEKSTERLVFDRTHTHTKGSIVAESPDSSLKYAIQYLAAFDTQSNNTSLYIVAKIIKRNVRDD